MDKVVWDRFYYKLVSVCKQQLVRDKAHGQIISFGLTEINAEINFSCVLFSFQSRIQKTGDGDQSVGPWNVFLYMQYLQEQSQHMFQCEVFHFCFFLFLAENVEFIEWLGISPENQNSTPKHWIRKFFRTLEVKVSIPWVSHVVVESKHC